MTDFGLAKRLKIGQRTGTICGTLQYIGMNFNFISSCIVLLVYMVCVCVQINIYCPNLLQLNMCDLMIYRYSIVYCSTRF